MAAATEAASSSNRSSSISSSNSSSGSSFYFYERENALRTFREPVSFLVCWTFTHSKSRMRSPWNNSTYCINNRINTTFINIYNFIKTEENLQENYIYNTRDMSTSYMNIYYKFYILHFRKNILRFSLTWKYQIGSCSAT